MKRLVFALLAVLSCALFVVPEQAVAQVPTADSLMGDHCYPLGFSDLKPGASATTPTGANLTNAGTKSSPNIGYGYCDGCGTHEPHNIIIVPAGGVLGGSGLGPTDNIVTGDDVVADLTGNGMDIDVLGDNGDIIVNGNNNDIDFMPPASGNDLALTGNNNDVDLNGTNNHVNSTGSGNTIHN